jgi:hypothetical protein
MLRRQITDQANLTIPKTCLAPALENSVRLHEMLMCGGSIKWSKKIGVRPCAEEKCCRRSDVQFENTFQPACRFADFDLLTILLR